MSKAERYTRSGRTTNRPWTTTTAAGCNLYRWFETGTGRYTKPDPLNLGTLLNQQAIPGMNRFEALMHATLRIGNPKFEHPFSYAASGPTVFSDSDGRGVVAIPVCAPALAALGQAAAAVTGAVIGAVLGDWLFDRAQCDECDDDDKPHCEKLFTTDGVTCGFWMSIQDWRSYHACMGSAMARYSDCLKGIFPPRTPLSPTPFGVN